MPQVNDILYEAFDIENSDINVTNELTVERKDSVAKGCASMTAIDSMRRAGVESAIVSLGGNVQTLGLKPDGNKWTVAVEDPSAPGTNAYIGTLIPIPADL